MTAETPPIPADLQQVRVACERIAMWVEMLQYRCQPNCGSNLFNDFWLAVHGHGNSLRADLEVLGQLLADPDLRNSLRETHDDAVKFGGAVAQSYAEAIFRVGERLYANLIMLCTHGVLYPYNHRGASSLPFDKPFPVLPAADAIKFERGHGGCLRSPEWLVGRICDVVGEMPRVQRLDAVQFIEKEISKAHPSPKDGPCGAYQWRHNGELLADKMQPAAWRLCKDLYPGSTKSFDDLKEPVYQDSMRVADANTFGSLRRAANRYFRDHEIPHSVTISKGSVTLTAE